MVLAPRAPSLCRSHLVQTFFGDQCGRLKVVLAVVPEERDHRDRLAFRANFAHLEPCAASDAYGCADAQALQEVARHRDLGMVIREDTELLLPLDLGEKPVAVAFLARKREAIPGSAKTNLG